MIHQLDKNTNELEAGMLIFHNCKSPKQPNK